MFSICAVLLCGVALTYGQTGVPPLPIDPDCRDRIDSCSSFPDTSCQEPYLEWAKTNCQQRCGFCRGTSTAPPPCVDNIKNCETYSKDICSKKEYKAWVHENCRAFCLDCTPLQIQELTTTTTTISMIDCYDKIDCRTYGANACAKDFADWSKENCPMYCGICQGTPTTPPPCVDRIPNCKAYNPTMCTDPDYAIWVQDNCKKFCGAC